MLQPEPRLLTLMKLTAQSQTRSSSLSAAAQALIMYALVAGREREPQETPQVHTALTVRRKHGIFFIRRMRGKA
jgi:hypothetical protein